MQKILEALGLKPDATEEEALAAIESLRKKAETPQVKEVVSKEILETLGLKEDAGVSEIKGTIMAMKQSHDQTGGLATKVKELSDKLAAKDADELVALAMKDGKITAAQKEWATEYARRDGEGFKVFVAKAPVVVPVGNETGAKGKKQGTEGIDETQLQINKALGVSEVTFKKYNQKS